MRPRDAPLAEDPFFFLPEEKLFFLAVVGSKSRGTTRGASVEPSPREREIGRRLRALVEDPRRLRVDVPDPFVLRPTRDSRLGDATANDRDERAPFRVPQRLRLGRVRRSGFSAAHCATCAPTTPRARTSPRRTPSTRAIQDQSNAARAAARRGVGSQDAHRSSRAAFAKTSSEPFKRRTGRVGG